MKPVTKKSLKTKTKVSAFKPWTRNAFVGLLIVVAISIILGCIGINWGETGYIPWQDDSLGGITTLREMPKLFDQWTYKYNRLQFMINAAFYKPFLDTWTQNPIYATNPDGQMFAQTLNYDRMNTLILVSNIISMLMGAATVIAVFLIARILFDDFLAAFFAALSLALCQKFIFYSHLGNIDVPAACWFAWGLYFTVKAVYIAKWRHFIFSGLFCSLAMSTKDSMPVYILGLIFAAAVVMVVKAQSESCSFRKAVFSLFNAKVLLASIIFLFCYAMLNDILTYPMAFIKRIGFWFGGLKTGEWDKDYHGQLSLLWSSCVQLYFCFGWPLLALFLVSMGYCFKKFRYQALFAAMPLIFFYLLVMKMRFVYPRYFIPAFPCLVLVAGKGCADFLRWRKIPAIIRAAPIIVVYLLSLLYCIGLDLELLGDSRYDAEKWLTKNVSRNEHIAIITNIRWAPRVQLTSLDYSFRIPGPYVKEPITASILMQKPVPQYVVLNENYLGSFTPAFHKAFLDGSLGYEQVARFENKYLYPKKTIFGLAGWPTSKSCFISPTVIVYKKTN